MTREDLLRLIGSCLDYPSVYMGGASQQSMRKAGRILETLAADGVVVVEQAEVETLRKERDGLRLEIDWHCEHATKQDGVIGALKAERDAAIASAEHERTMWERADEGQALAARQRDALRAALRQAVEALEPIGSLAAMTADGFPDHDICPIRLGQARAIRAALDDLKKLMGEG